MKKLLAICVNFNNETETVTFVNDLISQNDSDAIDVLIVDNSSGNEGQVLVELARNHAGVTVLEPGENIGFYPGAAWGLQCYLDSHELPDWLMVSNTDMRVLETNLTEKLSNLFPKRPPAVVAPSIVSTLTGIDQNPQIRKRPSRGRWYLYLIVFRFYPIFLTFTLISICKNFLIGKLRGKSPVSAIAVSQEPERIYAPHGSCVLFHRSYFESGASIVHGAFLFGETITVAEWARRKELKIVYEPRLRFLHREHSSTGRVKSPLIARHQYNAARYCWNAYFRKESAK